MSKNYYRLKAIIKSCCKDTLENGLLNMQVLDTIIIAYQRDEISRLEWHALCRFYNYYAYGDLGEI